MRHRLVLAACLVAVSSACSDSDDSDAPADDATGGEGDMVTEGDGSDVGVDETPADADVLLEASVARWTDASLEIDYALVNTGELELIVFDVGTATTTAIDDEGGVTLFQAKRDTGETDFAETPTIGGRNLSPGQRLEGSAERRLPIGIDFVAPLVSGLTPDTVELCIGYGNADDLIPLTRADGTYALNTDLELQSLVCTTLERP